MQSCNKRKLQQTARAHTLLLNLSKWFFVLLDLYKTMTFLEKMNIDYNAYSSWVEKNIFLQQMLLQHGLKT